FLDDSAAAKGRLGDPDFFQAIGNWRCVGRPWPRVEVEVKVASFRVRTRLLARFEEGAAEGSFVPRSGPPSPRGIGRLPESLRRCAQCLRYTERAAEIYQSVMN